VNLSLSGLTTYTTRRDITRIVFIDARRAKPLRPLPARALQHCAQVAECHHSCGLGPRRGNRRSQQGGEAPLHGVIATPKSP
jgi:hypothetical protein